MPGPYHGRNCPSCGSAHMYRSMRRGLFERVVLRILFKRPYRCENCGSRFYSTRKRVDTRLQRATVRSAGI